MALVTGAIGTLLPKLVQLLKEEYGLQSGVKAKVQSLSRELEDAHSVLSKIRDVPPEHVDELVRLWARDVREASYDMEDIVDTFLVRLDDAPEPAAEPRMLRRLKKKVIRLFKKSKARRNISTLIQDVNDRLKEVEARHRRYTVHDIANSLVAATTIDPRVVNLYKKATDLVGIEGPKDDLITMLSLRGDDYYVSSEEQKMKIVSVVGLGGLGKTTLAKAVYDQLRSQFECGAFVPVGRNPDVKKVFRDILIGLDGKNHTYSELNGLDEHQLMGKLNEFVKEKRCFIVIDDIWDKEPWKLIRYALQESHCGSRLVITTRISGVAIHACDETYRMQPLSRDDSKKLLYARIVDGEGKYLDSPSAEACDKILKKCGGVPLAIITIASLLASKSVGYWSEAYSLIGFGDEDNDDVGNTRKILSFSYYDLPSHLKACLLYLCIFPEDHVIKKNDLIWKWVAEGFVILTEEQAAAGLGLFELGERYFNELINRSMIQPVEEEWLGYIDACSVHDMIFDLINSISRKENFVTVLNGNDGERHKSLGSIARRLALQHVQMPNAAQLANVAVEKVRSLIARQCEFGASSPRFLFLRVLDMEKCYIEEDFDQGMILHLRYLRLQGTINVLPREVRYPKFLQTLDLEWRGGIEKLPEEVGLLTQLVCLRLRSYYFLPAGLISKLTSLQELWMESRVLDMQFVKELGLLRELRVLRIVIDVITGDSMGGALLDCLGNLHNIRELRILESSLWRHKDMVMSDAGFISCRHLQFLRFDYFVFIGLPTWITPSLAPNLSCLEVNMLTMKEQDMETLARLPELRCLKLHLCDPKLVTIKIHTKRVGYFRKLRKLWITGIISIFIDLHGSECNNSGGSRVASTVMPSLEVLEFDVYVRSLKDAALLDFDKLLGFQNIGRTSLRKVTADVQCGGTYAWELEEVEAALVNVAAVHPKNPTLHIDWRLECNAISPYQEACMGVGKNPELVNKAWKKMANNISSVHIQALRVSDPTASSSKVIRLLYTQKGMELLALDSNAVHKLWKWGYKSSPGKATAAIPPKLWQPKSGILMKNYTSNGNPEEAIACMALSKNHGYLVSASGGRLSLFNMFRFKTMTTFMPPPPAATFIAFHPLDNNIMAIGMEDSSIQIYDVRIDVVKKVLTGHEKKITGLVFSQLMNVLISSGADAQLCVWSIDEWKKKNSRYNQPSSNGSGALVGDTTVQFHPDQIHILVVHCTQLAIYDWKLEYLCSWSPRDALPSLVLSAVYSCDGFLVYAAFRDGSIGIFEAKSLALECRIAPSVYIPSSVSSGGETVYPTVVAANPWKPSQMAVGMSDGVIYVLEPPLDTDIKLESNASSRQFPPGGSSNGGGDGQQDVSDQPSR